MQGKTAKAIAALFSSKTLQEAAESLNINESTLFRWMQRPAFKKAFLVAKQRAVSMAITQLQEATGDAVETLRDIMTDEEAPCNSRVTAAKSVLEMAFKGFEIEDLEERISSLEEKLEGNKNGYQRQNSDFRGKSRAIAGG